MADQEKAIALLESWEEKFDTVITADRDRLIRAIEAGRITYSEGSETFIIELVKPINLENGDTLTMLEVSEPTVEQLRQAQKIKDEFAMSLRLLSQMVGQPEGVLGRMKARDMNLAAAVMGFFS
ncbi:hypothetical protein B4O97_03475 [Marispirochaeta aestuarii]|uniref:Phage tail protein n=1 Tax=Marispirochaeta aestuarii TaxID=1963862 RepID=A0A1Y1S1F4_9SPIO|nr:phage tail assembly protein [Marispirochaeta aestuarii]ORC37263.1 hypothetical protein B4O97_03475 [Marispirochaeta aestuarii]